MSLNWFISYELRLNFTLKGTHSQIDRTYSFRVFIFIFHMSSILHETQLFFLAKWISGTYTYDPVINLMAAM